jgi:hypothetical protein
VRGPCAGYSRAVPEVSLAISSSRVRAPARPRELLLRTPAWVLTAACGVAYVIASPPSTDLAAASYRSYLFSHAGFTLWDNAWFGGHHLPAYSVLAPPLGALLGPQLLAAASMTLASALFATLIAGCFSARAARIAALWFALGAAIGLLANRVPFDLGLALGLGALLAAREAQGRRAARRLLALALALACTLASPVAGAFLALALLAWMLATRPRFPRRPPAMAPIPGARLAPGMRRGAGRAWPAALALAALAPIALLALAFPEGGTQPFVASAFYPALGGVLLIAALIPAPRSDPNMGVLRAGALLYAAVLAGSFLVASPVGGNADRLGALTAGPLAACALGGRPARGWRRGALLALAPFLLYWQANAPVADFLAAASDPAVHASYYEPLLGELRTLGVGFGARAARVEAVPTRDHWEARWLAPHVALARGWERQLDHRYGGLFYDEAHPLTAARYGAWLRDEAVAYVALSDAPLDYSAQGEARLLRSAERERQFSGAAPAAAYLREVWRSAHWRLFAVLGARALADPPATVTRLGGDSFALDVPHAGTYLARVRFTPYWALARGHGCVRSAAGGWTALQARAAGSLEVAIDFSLARVFSRGPRCR